MRPHSASLAINSLKTLNLNNKPNDPLLDGLTSIEQNIVRSVMDEEERSNGWIRLFPTSDTWEFYSQFLETRSTSYNMMLHKKLYPRRYLTNFIQNTLLKEFVLDYC